MFPVEHNFRVIGTLVGDIKRQPSAKTKYGLLFEALNERFRVVDVYDASLKGLARSVNAVQVFHPDLTVWRQRFYKNLPAFLKRSRNAGNHIRKIADKADAVIQVGVLFDSRAFQKTLPTVLYTDYTAILSGRKPESGRSPFTSTQLQEWVELERLAFLHASHICTRGSFVRESIVSDYGVAPEKVTVIGGGVNLSPLPPIRSTVPHEPPTALFIGKDFYRKGGDILLRAFAVVRKRLPAARLLIVTGEKIPSGLVPDGVEIRAATWDRNKIFELYQNASCFVLPSRLETWGDVLLEAMAFSLPCIGVSGEAMEEIVLHQSTGLIIPPGDIEALAAAMETLLRNPDQAKNWGEAARSRVEQNFTWEKVVNRLAPAIQNSVETFWHRRQAAVS